MKIETNVTRRNFMKLGASFGMLAGLGSLSALKAATVQDYKALVCLFLTGGNDGHNLVVPRSSAQYSAYLTARGSLGLAPGQLLPISDPVLGPFGLHFSLPELQSIYNQNKLAILANVGTLVQPTKFSDLSNPNFPLPNQLRSHADQVVQMQTGYPDASGSTGWGGRSLDNVQSNNTNATFPTSISMLTSSVF